MKKSNFSKLVIFTLCAILGVFLSLQFRQNVENSTLVTLTSIQAMKNEINNTQNEIESIEELINKKSIELDNIKSAIDEGNVKEVLKEEVKDIKALGGYTDLQGPGISIIIDDNKDRYVVGENVMEDLVHDMDILNIINDLKIAGAEAISIKGQRVLSNSEVQCGGPVISINKRNVIAPFVIKAIGNPKQLYAAINAPGTYGDMLKTDFNLKVETIISDNILIPKHWEKLDLEYMKPVKEGE